VLRQKLRLAAPYLELWLAQANESATEADESTPVAAFVRIWQWLMLRRLSTAAMSSSRRISSKSFSPRKWGAARRSKHARTRSAHETPKTGFLRVCIKPDSAVSTGR
jgi:hypothetical protein